MTSPAVELIQAGPEHEPGIVPLMAAFNETEAIAWRPDSVVPALRRVLREPALGLVVVARERDTAVVVGYGLATFGYDLEFAGADAFVTELFVQPRARRRGIGRDLLDGIVKQLAAMGVKAVHLMVRPENRGARALYEHHGFREVPRLVMTKLLG